MTKQKQAKTKGVVNPVVNGKSKEGRSRLEVNPISESGFMRRKLTHSCVITLLLGTQGATAAGRPTYLRHSREVFN